MTITSTSRHKGLRVAATLADLDSGSGNARCRVYSGARPGTAGGTPAGTLLADIVLNKPCGTVAGNVLTLSASPVALAAASGTAGWARFMTGNGDVAFDADVSATGDGGDVQLSSLTIFAGGSIALVSGSLA